MTNPFSNPFGPEGTNPFDTPTPPAEPPRSPSLVFKIVAWVVLVFGVLVAIGALTDWTHPGVAVGMLLVGLAIILCGVTMLWRIAPWKIVGPSAGALAIIGLIIFGIASPTEEEPAPTKPLDAPSSSAAPSTTTSTVVSSTTVTVTAAPSSVPDSTPTAEQEADDEEVRETTPTPERRRTPQTTDAAPAPRTTQEDSGGRSFYANCDAVKAAGQAPLYAGQPGYRPALDGDHDGIACDR